MAGETSVEVTTDPEPEAEAEAVETAGEATEAAAEAVEAAAEATEAAAEAAEAAAEAAGGEPSHDVEFVERITRMEEQHNQHTSDYERHSSLGADDVVRIAQEAVDSRLSEIAAAAEAAAQETTEEGDLTVVEPDVTPESEGPGSRWWHKVW